MALAGKLLRSPIELARTPETAISRTLMLILLLVPATLLAQRRGAHGNMLLQFFDPGDLRRAVGNWEEVAGDLIRHLHDEIAARPADAETRTLRFFSTITTFGTPRDVTLDELRVECAFPADQATAELCRALAREDDAT